MESCVRIRPARAVEAEILTELSLRSKAYWGYNEAFMRRVRRALAISPAKIDDGRILVAEKDGETLGVAGLEVRGGVGQVEPLFVAPEAMSQGIGRRLFEALVEMASTEGCERILIISDPHAAGFYERMGAVLQTMVPSDAAPGRRLPFYRYDIG